MINLRVEDYCQDCPDFNPVAETIKFFAGIEMTKCETDVHCKYRDRCAAVAKWMKKKEGEENGDCMS